MFSGGAVNHWTSQVVATALKQGTIQQHLKEMAKELGVRINIQVPLPQHISKY